MSPLAHMTAPAHLDSYCKGLWVSKLAHDWRKGAHGVRPGLEKKVECAAKGCLWA